MLFNSLGFVGFFALFFLVYWTVLSRRLAGQNVWLLVSSLFFYACWDWRFLGLIGVTIISTYVTAILAENSTRAVRGEDAPPSQSTPDGRKATQARLLTAISIVVNLAILCTFKYFNFFGENLSRLMLWFGYELDWVTLDVLLPVGISFYTFQAIGYSIDVYRRNVSAERDLVDFAVFICYFPQLVAGPIESARSLLPQIKRLRPWRREEVVDGMRQALWGLFKKVVIADACAPHVAKAFEPVGDEPTLVTTLLAVLLFAVQIYCDFSGYCDMARGVSRCLGIDLIQNFRYPYFSRNVQEFWRRWNLSLMTWFRDYVYIPLGGSRRGQLRTYANLFVVFLLSGLWHGASWCFVVWGVYWGLIMVVYRLIDRNTSIKLPESWGILVTCLLAVMGWVIFRSNTLAQAASILGREVVPLTVLTVCGILTVIVNRILAKRVKGLGRLAMLVCGCALVAAMLLRPVEVVHAYLVIYIIIMVVVEWHRRSQLFPLSRLGCPAWMRVGIYWLLILLVLTNYMEEVPFIYFQF